MLNLRKVLGAKPKEHSEAHLKELVTPWGEALDPDHVLEEHPNPQLEREIYQVLNGRWRCAFVASGHEPTADLAAVTAAAAPPAPEAYDQDIIVPFSPEAPLSGVRRQLQPDELLWYRRTFPMPELAGAARCLLHFQAVDYACSCRLNGLPVGTHVGGYTPFTFDVTDFLQAGDNELAVCVADPSEFGGRLRGKQRFDRGDIWYTAQSGIWQTVWLEVVPSAFIEYLQVEPELGSGILTVGARTRSASELAANAGTAGRHAAKTGHHATSFHASTARHAKQHHSAKHDGSDRSQMLRLKVIDAEGAVVAKGKAPVEDGTGAVAVYVPEAHPWTPADPYLYRLEVSYGDDTVHSYCGFRTMEVRPDHAGHARLFLNGEPFFVKGVLDQAYWPDGLMTAPADEALVFDIEAMREAGFNLMRKHIKIESARWYYHCDRLGMLVLQDMVSGGAPDIIPWHWSYKPTLFKFTWNRYADDTLLHQEKLGAGDEAYRDEWMSTARATVGLLRNHPSIIGWSLFNEGWGQFDARAACAMVRQLDRTRAIDAVSGWYDQQCGDFSSVHNYFRTLEVWRCRLGRAFFISEFGGFSHHVEGHSSLDECYGYEIYDSLDEWRAAVHRLIAHMDGLQPKGLAGYVYTQVSDIEEETNGILTYDRRVNKLGETR